MDSQETPTTSSSRGAAVNVPLETATASDHENQPEARPDDIDNALVEPTASGKLQIMTNIDHEGDYKAPTLAPAVEASLPSNPAVASRCKTPPRRMSHQQAKPGDIITAQRVPTLHDKDVKIGEETLVINASLMTIDTGQTNIFRLNQAPKRIDVDQIFKARFRELETGLPPKAKAAEELSQEAHTVKGPDHVPPCVSEGRVATISMDVNKTGVANFVPSMEMRRSPAGEGSG